MTNKEKIQRLVSRFDDDIPLHVAVERMALLKDIEESLEDLRVGDVLDHDAFMAELDAENEEIQARVDAEG